MKPMFIISFLVLALFAAPVFAAEKPVSSPQVEDKTSKCEKCFRDKETGKVKCEPVPCVDESKKEKEKKS